MQRHLCGIFSSVLVAALLLLPQLASAQPSRTTEPYNSVELQAEASREIANDTLHAVLYAEANDADAARLADTLNRVSNDALKQAAAVKGVRARTGGNGTYPVYDRNQRLTGWRGRAEIRLESRDFQAAATLIAKLQASMQLSSLSFNISRELRLETENELIVDAFGSFRARAEIVRQALGGKGYRLRRAAINTSGSAPPPRPLLRMAAGVASASEVAVPQLEAGQSTVTVSISGTVEVE